ncbi:lysozyme [Burkholderia guangdongensis]|uniref:lysozyme n=1 Tax=Burkholderia guangdongensis TaxID=1792500 RepID=UPI0015CB6F70|nr:lysozyme [Burkholderia guangdongensis]
MTPSINCINLVEASEGCVLTSYQDSVGVWTIGYGHTAGVAAGMTITDAQAIQYLEQDLAAAGAAVSRLVTVTLSQNQYDALTDFVFNLGQGSLAESTLLKLLNMGNYTGAANQFHLWVYAGGKVLPGLVARRAAEAKLFETPA